MRNIIKKYIPYFVFIFSIILLILSSIVLYNTGNTEISIKSDTLNKASKINLDRYENDKKYFNKEILSEGNLKKQDKDIKVKNLLNYTKNTKITIYSECLEKNQKGTKLYNECISKYYFHKYAKLLNGKGIIDKRICGDIKTIFGVDSYLYNRCNFIYEVNKGTKFLNISGCGNLPIESKYGFNKEKCENNIIYSSFGNDNTIGKYLKTVKERKDGKNSALYTDILNKNGNILDGKVQGTDFFEFNLGEYLKSEYLEFTNNNTN